MIRITECRYIDKNIKYKPDIDCEFIINMFIIYG